MMTARKAEDVKVSGNHRLAIDVGGTFTDFVLIDDRDGVVRFGKVLSTPDDPSTGSVDGAREALLRCGVAAGDVREVIHATTVATNAVLERGGAVTGLVTTQGFRDILEMGREARYDIYDLNLVLPEPLVGRPHRLEVDERIDHEGAVLTPLDEDSVQQALRQLVESGVQSLAICLLHSHVNGSHEQRIAAIARERHPQLEVSVSSEVAGEVREYERTSTACVDAYVKPLVRRYIGRLEDGLRALGITRNLALMLSHGGVGAARDVAERFPVRMIESGPAAGAIAAAYLSDQALDHADAIAFDMGGTTAKISLVRGGMPAITHEYEVAHVHRFKRGSGIPLQISAIELLEIGAGGGSIARLNNLGLLTVGPQSAGAKPGPVCYGRGGSEPTVTDADLVLGYLDPDFFLGGDMRLDLEAARAAMGAQLGQRLAMTPVDVACGIHNIVNEHMSAAVRAHGAEKGVDLRRFSLIAFGGAGPIHAYAIARKLKLARVLCPFGAGVASAIGCLVAPPAVDLVASHQARLAGLDWGAVAARFAAMRESAASVIRGLAGDEAALSMRPEFEMRCAGQGYSVAVALPADTPIEARLETALTTGFRADYEKLYGHLPPPVPLEIVNLRARVSHVRETPRIRAAANAAGRGGADRAVKGTRSAYFEAAAGFVPTAVYDRYRLECGDAHDGPAIIEERETSIVVGPDARFRIDEHANVIIEFSS
jgi:N-methylhydantoinase A